MNNINKALTEQESFWALEYATEYINKNSKFDSVRGVDAWKKMLAKASNIKSLLECGCNIGRNLKFLNEVLPDSSKSIIEISKPAFDKVIADQKILRAYNGSIMDSNFSLGEFDLVFTMGVLIHIHPQNLISNMQKMFGYSNKYILIGEYFNRTPVQIEYQGKLDKLFKCDFGSLFADNFEVTVVDYGFLWGRYYDDAGFDDFTWWLFEKK